MNFNDLIDKVPRKLMPNTLKAFDRLCASVIDIPTAYLESVAKEKRAEIEGRVKLTQESSKQIADQMNIPAEYIKTSSRKFAHRVIREQINLDKITEKAVKELEKSNDTKDQPQNSQSNSQRIINDDWLNNFEKEARYKSTEEMQTLFGRVLAGEIKQPGFYSMKAVKTLGELDQEVARLFRRLCSYSMIHPIPYLKDIRVCSLGDNANFGALQKFNLSPSELNILNEYNLIISNFHSSYAYPCVLPRGQVLPYIARGENLFIKNSKVIAPIPFYHQKNYWILKSLNNNTNMTFNISGVALSKTGRELYYIVHVHNTKEYTNALKEYFYKQNLEMMFCSE